MPVSNFPKGFNNGVNIGGIPRLDMFSGNVFWVHSVTGADATSSGTKNRPFATINYAVSRCTASNGDIIIVKEKHAETCAAAGSITVDKAGVTIIGLGLGSQRPIISVGTLTSATFLISATGVTIQNLVFSATLADVVTAINVTAKDANILQCEFVESAADLNILTPVKATSTTNNNADGLRVDGCRWNGVDANSLEFLEVNANLDRLTLDNNFVTQVASTATPLILVAGTKVLTGARIANNFIQNGNTANDLLIDNGGSTGQSGIVYNNMIGNLDVTGAQLGGAATGLQFFNNMYTSTSLDSGALSPAADTPLS